MSIRYNTYSHLPDKAPFVIIFPILPQTTCHPSHLIKRIKYNSLFFLLLLNYQISYNLDGGTLSTTNPHVYSKDSSTITLNNISCKKSS